MLQGVKNYQTKEAETALFKQKDMFEQYFSYRFNLNNSGTTEKVQLARVFSINPDSELFLLAYMRQMVTFFLALKLMEN